MTRPIPAEVSKPQSVQAITRLGSPPGASDVFQAVGDDLRMLDKARQIINDASSDDLIVGEREFLQYAIFMLINRGDGDNALALVRQAERLVTENRDGG